MIIYPTIELQNGKCVSLNRGNLDQPTIWHVDPVAKAKEYAALGAEWLHVTDLDAVVGGKANDALVEQIIRAAEIPVQVAGGVRTVERIQARLDYGAARVVVGSSAIMNPSFLKDAAKRFPDQIVLSVDVWQGKVVKDGWRAVSAFEPISFINEFEDAPLAAIVLTDIDTHIGDAEDALSLVTSAAASARAPVIASGIVRSLDDISRLKYVHNVSGTLIGRALFQKDVNLVEAIAVAQAPSGPTAEFI